MCTHNLTGAISYGLRKTFLSWNLIKGMVHILSNSNRGATADSVIKSIRFPPLTLHMGRKTVRRYCGPWNDAIAFDSQWPMKVISAATTDLVYVENAWSVYNSHISYVVHNNAVRRNKHEYNLVTFTDDRTADTFIKRSTTTQPQRLTVIGLILFLFNISCDTISVVAVEKLHTVV